MNKPCNITVTQPVIRAMLSRPQIHAQLTPSLMLSQNYPDMSALPKINGVTLLGDKSAAALSLLSARAEDYMTVDMASVRDTHYVLALGRENGKVKLSALMGTRITTVSEIPTDMDVGDYIFLEKE